MKLKKLIVYVAGGLLTIAAVGAVTAPKLTAAIRGAFVEIVIPSHPYASSILLTQNAAIATGPDTGTLGVTSITLTNFEMTNQTVFLWAPTMNGGGCGLGVLDTTLTKVAFGFYATVPAGQTIHLTYPSPLTFSGIDGHTCVAGLVVTPGTSLNTVAMVVNGFVN